MHSSPIQMFFNEVADIQLLIAVCLGEFKDFQGPVE